MHNIIRLVNIYGTLIRNFGVFADDGEMVQSQVQSSVEDAIEDIYRSAPENAPQAIGELRAALVRFLQELPDGRQGSKKVLELAISLLPRMPDGIQ